MSAIDVCVHHRWARDLDLHEYLPDNWRGYLGRPSSGPGSGKKIMPGIRYTNPRGGDLAWAHPAEGPAGSDYETLARQLLDGNGLERALLLLDRAMFAPAIPNHFLAAAVVRAVNDWNIDRWLSRDDRLHGVALVPVQTPDDAAAEIRRVGAHPKIAGVLMASGIGKLFGHPLYYPIYEAAAELELPIVIHRGLDGIAETEMSSGPAGGPPLTFAEYDSVAPLALVSQVMSLITDGVFERFPSLRVVVVGGGVTWLPAWVRRMDLLYQAERRDMPWLRRTPTEYVRDHVRVCTYGIERGQPEMLRRFLAGHPEMRDLLCYGSGYPSWDTVSVADMEELLPEDWHAAVLRDNADAVFRWSTDAAAQQASAGASA